MIKPSPLFVLFLVTSMALVFDHVADAAPIINSSNNTLEINLTGENVNEAGHNALNTTSEVLNKTKENLPDEVNVKLPGFGWLLVLIALILADMEFSKQFKSKR